LYVILYADMFQSVEAVRWYAHLNA